MPLTRRDILKCGCGLAGMLLARKSPAIVRGIIAAHNIDSLHSGTSIPTASDYIQDGLLAMWDGIENAGVGIHDETITEWVDLTGGEMLKYAVKPADVGPLRTTYEYNDIVFSGDAVFSNGTSSYIAGPAIDLNETDGLTISYCTDLSYSPYLDIGWTEAAGVYRRPSFCKGGTETQISFISGNINSHTYTPENIQQTIDCTWGKPIQGATSPWAGNEGFRREYINGDQIYYTPNGSKFWQKDSACPTSPWFRVFAYGASSYSESTKGIYRYTRSKVYNIRVYGRELSQAELAYNYAIDRIRFNFDGEG